MKGLGEMLRCGGESAEHLILRDGTETDRKSCGLYIKSRLSSDTNVNSINAWMHGALYEAGLRLQSTIIVRLAISV